MKHQFASSGYFPQTDALPGCATPRLVGTPIFRGLLAQAQNSVQKEQNGNLGVPWELANKKSHRKSHGCSRFDRTPLFHKETI